MAKVKKILAVEKELYNKVEKLASQNGLNFQNYVYMVLAQKTKEEGDKK